MIGAMIIATGIATSNHFVFFILLSPGVNTDPTRLIARAAVYFLSSDTKGRHAGENDGAKAHLEPDQPLFFAVGAIIQCTY